MNTDPIADMLTRLRNAAQRRKREITLPTSRLKEAVAKILTTRGYLESYRVEQPETGPASLHLGLRYLGMNSVINGIRRISRPGQRIHEGVTNLDKLMSIQAGDIIVSTTKGLLTGREAKKAGLGGEVLFRIW